MLCGHLRAASHVCLYARIPRVIEGKAVSPIHRSRGCQTEAIDRVTGGQPEYLQRRGVDLYLDFRIAQLSSGQANIHLGEVEGRILSYRAPLLEQLKTRGARFEDFPSYLDQHLESYRQLPKAEQQPSCCSFVAII